MYIFVYFSIIFSFCKPHIFYYLLMYLIIYYFLFTQNFIPFPWKTLTKNWYIQPLSTLVGLSYFVLRILRGGYWLIRATSEAFMRVIKIYFREHRASFQVLLKVWLPPSKKVGFIHFSESPSEMIKIFLFYPKYSSFLRYLIFCVIFLVM